MTNKLTSNKFKVILPIIMTILFSLFLIPIFLSLIILSPLLKKKIQELFQRYGYGTVILTIMMSNIKGLSDLFITDFKEKRAKDV